MAVLERKLKLRNAALCGVALFFGLFSGEARAEATPEEARERIKFSNPFEGVRAPEREKNDPNRTRRFFNNDVTADRGFGGGSSLAPVVPSYVPPAPRVMPDRKTLELQDQRRNWIFAQPEGSEPKQSVEQMFGVREVDLQGRDRRFQSVVGKYLENDGNSADRPAMEASDRMNSFRQDDALPDFTRFHNSNMSLAPVLPASVPEAALNLSAPSTAFSGWQADAGVGGLRVNSLPEQGRNWNGDSDFRRNNWDSPWQSLSGTATANITPGAFDPINSMRDTTAQALNPITPSFAPAVPNPLSASSLTPWDDRFQAPLPGGRSSSLDDFNARVSAGPSQAASSQSLLQDSRAARSQPIILPPPRRQF